MGKTATPSKARVSHSSPVEIDWEEVKGLIEHKGIGEDVITARKLSEKLGLAYGGSAVRSAYKKLLDSGLYEERQYKDGARRVKGLRKI